MPAHPAPDRLNILLVDDQPAKLLTYEAILADLGENLLRAGSAREALEALLRHEVAVVLLDVCMPELDGFELAEMIRQHPRCQRTAIILVSAVLLSDLDRLKGYGSGAMDYVPVPVVPEILRAKVAIFTELYRKTRALERMNEELERRVDARTAALAATTAQLRESEERFRLATAAGHCGTWDWELPTGRLSCSDETLRLVGIPTDDFVGDVAQVRELIHPDDRERVFSHLEGLLAAGAELYVEEHRMTRRDGSVVWLATQGRISYDEAGHPARLVGVCFDVTHKKEAELERRRHKEELERLVEERTRELDESYQRLRFSERMAAIGTLAAGIGHDLGNLLLPVRMRLDTLQSRDLPSEVRRDLTAIQKATQYVQRLTSGLRLLAQDPDERVPSGESVDLEEWWAEAEPLLRSVVPGNVEVRALIPGALPRIGVSRPAFAQAVFNLVQNAGDALRQRGIGVVEIRAEADPENGRVTVQVKDDGPGMPEQVRQRCLEPFFTTRSRSFSTGLGLPLVVSVVSRAGGAIEVDSTPGVGTCFTMHFPVASATAVVAPSTAPPPVAVLSVKNVRTRAVLSSILRNLHFQVETGEWPATQDARLWILEGDAPAGQGPEAFVDRGPDHRALVLTNAPAGRGNGRIVELAGKPKPGEVRATLTRLAAECLGR
jgi:PAS domain S-box-containing protein